MVVASLALLLAAIALRRESVPKKSSRRIGLITRFRRRLKGKAGRKPEEHAPRPIRGNPVAWREIHAGTGGGRRGGIHAGIAYAVILAGALLLFGMFGRDSLAFGFGAVSNLLWLATYLAVMRVASASFAADRESKTLGLLLATPLTTAQILKGKLTGVIWNLAPRAVILIAASGAPFLIHGSLYGRFGRFGVMSIDLPAFLGMIVNLFFAASLGLFYSLRYEGAASALIATVVTYLVATYVLMIPAMLGFGITLLFSITSFRFLIPPILKGVLGLIALRLAARKLKTLRATPETAQTETFPPAAEASA
jgi:hypothetical protein